METLFIVICTVKMFFQRSVRFMRENIALVNSLRWKLTRDNI